ncbi:ABC transporter substrate-binding protein [Martelella alba]|uniref:ABC transporter substrate-binding protein n=1 Tax=Martelella alba TaxID=2590451 RepID=A0ABY2SP84_9HYPH|nr:ABC transporter substrate-binding protein [Martelella alba]TKI07206.1 ABC transporter substrate-binding protein [Martelella alba]
MLLLIVSAVFVPGLKAAETIDIGIGTQDTTTNTVTAGVVIKNLGLLDKYLPHSGKYQGVKYNITWLNATSGPPITNSMIAGKLQIGMMGDYPLLVNGATGQQLGNNSELVAVIAYNRYGSGNGIVVPKDSPYYDIADLKGKVVSVPFGSAAHGMVVNALAERGLPPDYFKLISQSPEVGSTSLQEKRIDAHADFVPFPELLSYRGIGRKIYDGAETGIPTFHGIVVRKDFAQKYPEVVVGYLKAVLAADQWLKANPIQAAEKIEQWTKIDKEVAYIYLGPDGIHTLDSTIKPILVDALKKDYALLRKMNLVKELNIDAWVNDRYIKQAYQEMGMDYAKQLKSFDNYGVKGFDPECKVAITDQRLVGQILMKDGELVSYSSPDCTFAALSKTPSAQVDTVYLIDHTRQIKVFASNAFYNVNTVNGKKVITPFMLKGDAQAFTDKNGGKLEGYQDVLDNKS